MTQIRHESKTTNSTTGKTTRTVTLREGFPLTLLIGLVIGGLSVGVIKEIMTAGA